MTLRMEKRSRIDCRCDDEDAIPVKTIRLSIPVDNRALENSTENLANLRHPCASCITSVVFAQLGNVIRHLTANSILFDGGGADGGS
jgi:hypothetical protein